jgi:hypothetical protein
VREVLNKKNKNNLLLLKPSVLFDKTTSQIRTSDINLHKCSV